MDDDVLLVQRCYPQIYLACHLQHVRRTRSPHRISDHESRLLGHLDRERPSSPSWLAKHLGLGQPAVSAALARLEALGYVERRRSPRDLRAHELRLTERGAEALAGSSVLDAALVERLLSTLSKEARQEALAGLQILATAAQSMVAEKGRFGVPKMTAGSQRLKKKGTTGRNA